MPDRLRSYTSAAVPAATDNSDYSLSQRQQQQQPQVIASGSSSGLDRQLLLRIEKAKMLLDAVRQSHFHHGPGGDQEEVSASDVVRTLLPLVREEMVMARKRLKKVVKVGGGGSGLVTENFVQPGKMIGGKATKIGNIASLSGQHFLADLLLRSDGAAGQRKDRPSPECRA